MTMKRITNHQVARQLLPYLATILSASLAVTLRVEHSCSSGSTLPAASPTPVIYPYAEILPALKLHRRRHQRRLDQREMMVAVSNRVILENELTRQRSVG